MKAGSGALTFGQPDSAGIPASFTQQTIVLPFNDPDAVQAAFVANRGQVAGVILEPVPANAGLYFLGMVASIERQFVPLQDRMRGIGPRQAPAPKDAMLQNLPLLASPGRPGPNGDNRVIVTRGGEYLYLPSINFVRDPW